jgi:hypothetical protein
MRTVATIALCLVLVSCVPWVSVQTTKDGYVLCAEVVPAPAQPSASASASAPPSPRAQYIPNTSPFRTQEYKVIHGPL